MGLRKRQQRDDGKSKTVVKGSGILLKMGSQKIKNVLSAGVLGLALIPWLPWSCQTRPYAPPAPPAPPPPSYFDLGEKYFDAGDYAKAAEAYNLYIQGNSMADYQDRALYRLALAHALPASPVRDLPRATELLQRLVRLFPQSPYTAQAEFLLQLQTEMEQLRDEMQQREAQLQQLHQELAQLQQVQVEIQVRQGEIEKLRADVTKREERIRQLTQELEKLKQIDMQRRPSSLPP